MGLEVIITEDYQSMSEVAAAILLEILQTRTKIHRDSFNLGLATGSSPVGLYQIIADNQHLFDATKITSWNLDEYVGLPGDNSSERIMHPESYSFFMIQRLFGKLQPTFAKMHIPPATLINQQRLDNALQESQDSSFLIGESGGKAIVIPEHCKNTYLRWIYDSLMQPYIRSIEDAGGIDTWVVGTGGKGHIAFHESGIPFDCNILLVRLDHNTVENAIKDGHFHSVNKCPKYAISIGASGVISLSKNVILLASGKRKTEPVAKSLLEQISPDIPISILQTYIGTQKSAIYIIDEIAAQSILGKEELLQEKGIHINDLRNESYSRIIQSN